jgi:hypothetical protein
MIFCNQSWLDSESTYRLTVEKAKEATEGATFARNEYEKWHDANKQAKKDRDATLARHAIERQDLADERAIIRLIMRYIGEFFSRVQAGAGGDLWAGTMWAIGSTQRVDGICKAKCLHANANAARAPHSIRRSQI